MTARRLSIVNLKGGSAKTTSAVFIAHCLQERGEQVLLVDADPQGSAIRWSELAERWLASLPAAVLFGGLCAVHRAQLQLLRGLWDEAERTALPTKNLHKQLPGITPREITYVVIDTPPLALQAGIVYSSARASTQVVVPMAPTPGEADVLPDVKAVLEEIEPLRQNPLPHAVSLNRTVYRAISTRATRAAAEANGWPVFETEVPRKELYSQAFGSPIKNLGAYKALTAEITAMEVR